MAAGGFRVLRLVAALVVVLVVVANGQRAVELPVAYGREWRAEKLAAVPPMAVLYAPLTPFHNDSAR
jgi:hypothetical protein